MIIKFLKVTSILCLCFYATLKAQEQDSIKLKYFPFDSIAKGIESKNNIKLFYNPIWFEGKEFKSNISILPLPEAISLITQITQFSVVKLKESYYVFVPQSLEGAAEKDSLNYYEIGNILDYGSKSSAVVNGTVINGHTSLPIAGASIEVVDLKKSYESNQYGRFTLNLPVGEHELEIDYPGYESRRMKTKVLSDGSISIELMIKTILLDEVSVFASKIDQYYRRTKMSVTSMDAKTIKELPSNLGETDIIKGLSLMPGVQTTGEFGSGFNVRGGSTDQNLILLEEVPIFNTSHLFGLISIINPDGVSEATLYKGGLPAMYGERASSILSIKMGDENLNQIRVKGGIGLLNSRLSVEIPFKNKLQIILGGRASYSDWMLRSIPDEDLMNSSANFNDFNAYVNYSLNKKDNFTLYVYGSNDKFSLSGINNYKYGNLLGSFSYSHRFNSKLYTNILFGISHYNAELVERDSLQLASSYQTINSILYKSGKWNIVYNLNESHIISAGTNAFIYTIAPGELRPDGERSLVIPMKVEEENGLEWAGFISDDIKINNKIGIEVGLRYSGFSNIGPRKTYFYSPGSPKTIQTITDSAFYNKGDNIKSYSGFEPRFSFRWNLNNYSSIRLSYNRNFQYINLVSKTSVTSPTDLWKLSDFHLKPLQSNQIAVGYFKDLKNKSYETSVEVYYKTYKNLIEYKNDADIFLNNHIETELVPAEALSYGIEFYIKKNTGKLNGWLSYTLSKAERRTISNHSSEQVNNNEWYPDNLDRLHNLVVNGGYSITRRWKLGFLFNYNTGRPVTLPEMKFRMNGYQVVYYSSRNEYRMPDYHRLDLSITHLENLKTKKMWKSYWTFSITNVYSRKNAYSIFYQRDRDPNSYQGRSNLYKLYIIGRPLPTFTYNFVF